MTKSSINLYDQLLRVLKLSSGALTKGARLYIAQIQCVYSESAHYSRAQVVKGQCVYMSDPSLRPTWNLEKSPHEVWDHQNPCVRGFLFLQSACSAPASLQISALVICSLLKASESMCSVLLPRFTHLSLRQVGIYKADKNREQILCKSFNVTPEGSLGKS